MNRQTANYAIQIGIVTLAFIYFFAGKEEAKMETKIALAGLAAFIVVFGLNILWNYLLAPARLQREADKRIDFLEDQLYSKRLEVMQKVRPHGDSSFFLIVEAYNPTKNTIRNVSAELYEVTPLPEKSIDHLFNVPVRQDVPRDIRSPESESLDLHPEQTCAFEVGRVVFSPGKNSFSLSVVRTRPQSDPQGQVRYFPVRNDRGIPISGTDSCELTAIVRGEDTEPQLARFTVNTTNSNIEW